MGCFIFHRFNFSSVALIIICQIFIFLVAIFKPQHIEQFPEKFIILFNIWFDRFVMSTCDSCDTITKWIECAGFVYIKENRTVWTRFQYLNTNQNKKIRSIYLKKWYKEWQRSMFGGHACTIRFGRVIVRKVDSPKWTLVSSKKCCVVNDVSHDWFRYTHGLLMMKTTKATATTKMFAPLRIRSLFNRFRCTIFPTFRLQTTVTRRASTTQNSTSNAIFIHGNKTNKLFS